MRGSRCCRRRAVVLPWEDGSAPIGGRRCCQRCAAALPREGGGASMGKRRRSKKDDDGDAIEEERECSPWEIGRAANRPRRKMFFLLPCYNVIFFLLQSYCGFAIIVQIFATRSLSMFSTGRFCYSSIIFFATRSPTSPV